MSNKLSNTIERVKYLIETLGLSQRTFSAEVGISHSLLSNAKTLGSDKLEKILETYPRVNASWLLTGRGDMFNDSYVSANKMDKILNEPEIKYVKQQTVTVDNSGKNNIVMVDARASAGYPSNIDNKAYFQELPSFQIPRPQFQNGSFRCFEVNGDSMEPTLAHGSWIFGRQHNRGEKIADGRIYGIVTSEGFLVKRVLDRSAEKGQLALVSDNSSYRTQVIDTADVLELWYVTANLNFDLRNTHKDLREDLNQVIGDIALMQNEISSLRKLLNQKK